MKISNVNKLGFFIMAVSSIVLTSCKKSATLVKVTVPVQMAQIAIVIPPSQTVSDTTVTIYCNVDSIIRADNPSFNGTNIKSVTAAAANLFLSNADNTDNFGNFSSVEMQIFSTENTTATTFAQVTNNPAGYADVLNLPITPSIELKNYFDATLFTFTFRSSLASQTFITLNATATINFNVVVGPN
jgi:hypothetical protein